MDIGSDQSLWNTFYWLGYEINGRLAVHSINRYLHLDAVRGDGTGLFPMPVYMYSIQVGREEESLIKSRVRCNLTCNLHSVFLPGYHGPIIR